MALLTTLSKLHIESGLVRICAGMVGILLNSCSPRKSSNDLHLSLGFVLRERRREFELATVAESELLTEDARLRRCKVNSSGTTGCDYCDAVHGCIAGFALKMLLKLSRY
jgi:hypothetical protein